MANTLLDEDVHNVGGAQMVAEIGLCGREVGERGWMGGVGEG